MTVDTALTAIPRPIVAGAKHEALRPFHRDGTWEGVIHAGGMGPGTPEQSAKGTAVHHWIQDGRWVVGDYAQDQFLGDGTFVLKWELHWVCGWDSIAGDYRATIADNYGRMDVLGGRIDGDRMIFESLGNVLPRIRLTWDASSPDAILWRNEMSVDGQTWFLIEDYRIVQSQ
jgi:hypothetical protein